MDNFNQGIGQGFTWTYPVKEFERETDKAIAIKFRHIESNKEKIIWFPKSQISIMVYIEPWDENIKEAQVPEWLAIEKEICQDNGFFSVN